MLSIQRLAAVASPSSASSTTASRAAAAKGPAGAAAGPRALLPSHPLLQVIVGKALGHLGRRRQLTAVGRCLHPALLGVRVDGYRVPALEPLQTEGQLGQVHVDVLAVAAAAAGPRG